LPCGLWRFTILDVAGCLHCNVGREFIVQFAFEIAPLEEPPEKEAQHIFCHVSSRRVEHAGNGLDQLSPFVLFGHELFSACFGQGVVLGSLIVF
jgi:hypothetical protein